MIFVFCLEACRWETIRFFYASFAFFRLVNVLLSTLSICICALNFFFAKMYIYSLKSAQKYYLFETTKFFPGFIG